MLQVIFIALIFISLLAGYFAHTKPQSKDVNPVGFMMDNSGYNSLETLNNKRSEKIHMTTEKGILAFHKKLDDLATRQSKVMDALKEQQDVLDGADKDAHDILLKAQAHGEAADRDVLQLERLTREIQDQKNLMVGRGKQLIMLNDQLTQTRNTMAEQVTLANINTDSALHSLQQFNVTLDAKTSVFFTQVDEHNRHMRDDMDRIRIRMTEYEDDKGTSRYDLRHDMKYCVECMFDRENDAIQRLKDSEERSREIMDEQKQKIEDAKEKSDDSLQQTRDLMDEERQKADDEKQTAKQRIADEEQRIKDQQNR